MRYKTLDGPPNQPPSRSLLINCAYVENRTPSPKQSLSWLVIGEVKWISLTRNRGSKDSPVIIISFIGGGGERKLTLKYDQNESVTYRKPLMENPWWFEYSTVIKGCRCLGWVHAFTMGSVLYIQPVRTLRSMGDVCWAGLRKISKVKTFTEERVRGGGKKNMPEE